MSDLPALVRLVTCSTAPNPRRVDAVLAEKGVEVERVEIDLASRAHFAPEHVAKFGSHHLPAAELSDGTTLTETVAIQRYVEALHPEPNLLGRDPVEVAKIEQAHRRVELYFMLPVAMVFRHSHPSMATLETQVPDWAEANRPRVVAALADMDRRLAAQPYLAGDRMSVADLTAFIALDFMRVTKIAIPDDHAALLAWRDALAERPSLARPGRRG